MSDAPHVRFERVEKSYDGETLVVIDLNLKIRRGEFLTLLGPSGSGKTTTLAMLAGFEEPTRGEIFLDGRSMAGVPPHRRNLGVVFQDYALFPHMSVFENVAFPLTARRVPESERRERVQAALAMVELSAFADRRPMNLSGGQQQRVALARALVFSPNLVLMDEPLGALDKQLRDLMRLEIKRIHKSLGVTVLYVTHDQQEALTMSDRVAIFRAGRILQLGTPDELYETPANLFVAQFIGENNRLPGRIVARNGSTVEVALDGGGRVSAVPGNVAEVGRPTVLSVRPERVILQAEADSLPNRFDARVEDLIYQGDSLRLHLRLVQGDARITMTLANTAHRNTLRPGAVVTIGWAAADCRALDSPSPGDPA